METYSIYGGTRYCQSLEHRPRYATVIVELDGIKEPMCIECFRVLKEEEKKKLKGDNKVINLILFAALLLTTYSLKAENTPFGDTNDTNFPWDAYIQFYKESPQYLGNLSANPYQAESTSNPFGAGNIFGTNSISNPYGRYGNPYGTNSVSNPFVSDSNAPAIYDSEGNYHGRASANPYGTDSISNPYGRYGSPYSPDSINNPFGAGNPYRADSPNNPYGSGWKMYGK